MTLRVVFGLPLRQTEGFLDSLLSLMSGGVVLEEMEISLTAYGQEAQFIEEMFTGTDTSDFVGSVRCTAPGPFTGVAVELDAQPDLHHATGGAGSEMTSRE